MGPRDTRSMRPPLLILPVAPWMLAQAANSKLLESVEGLKQELAGINSVADQAR